MFCKIYKFRPEYKEKMKTFNFMLWQVKSNIFCALSHLAWPSIANFTLVKYYKVHSVEDGRWVELVSILTFVQYNDTQPFNKLRPALFLHKTPHVKHLYNKKLNWICLKQSLKGYLAFILFKFFIQTLTFSHESLCTFVKVRFAALTFDKFCT